MNEQAVMPAMLGAVHPGVGEKSRMLGFPHITVVPGIGVEHVEPRPLACGHAQQPRVWGAGEQFVYVIRIGDGVEVAMATVRLGDCGPLVLTAREYWQAAGSDGKRDRQQSRDDHGRTAGPAPRAVTE
jgi:hypothetical protein